MRQNELIICSACEAVSGPGALHCQVCGAALGPEPGAKWASAAAGGRIHRGHLALLLTALSLARSEANGKRAVVHPARRFNLSRLALISGVVVVATAGLVYGIIEGRPAKSALEVTPVKVVEPPAPLPPTRTEPKAEAPALAAPASIVPAPEPRPSTTRVTHTAPPSAGETPPSAVVPRAALDPARKPEAACGEAVTVLGLCGPSAK